MILQYSILKCLRILLGIIAFFSITQILKASEYNLEFNTYLVIGDRYFEQFDNYHAIKEYEKANKLSPGNIDILMRLTRSYNDYGEDMKESKPYEAEIYFKKAIENAEILNKEYPDRAEPYFLLAEAYGNMARFKGGKDKVKLARDIEKNSKKAIELNPYLAPAYVVLGIYYREVANLSFFEKVFANTFLGGMPKGTNEDSKNMLRKAVELSPESIYVHFDLAETYEKLNEKGNAIEHYKKVLELHMTDHQDMMKKEKAEKRLNKLQDEKLRANRHKDPSYLN